MRVGGDVGVSILPEGPYTATAGSNLVFTCIGGYNRSDSHYYKMRNGPFYLAIKSRASLDYIGLTEISIIVQSLRWYGLDDKVISEDMR